MHIDFKVNEPSQNYNSMDEGKSTLFMSPSMGDNYNFMSKLNNYTLIPSKKGGSNGWVNLKERQNIIIIQCMRIACERLTPVTRECKL